MAGSTASSVTSPASQVFFQFRCNSHNVSISYKRRWYSYIRSLSLHLSAVSFIGALKVCILLSLSNCGRLRMDLAGKHFYIPSSAARAILYNMAMTEFQQNITDCFIFLSVFIISSYLLISRPLVNSTRSALSLFITFSVYDNVYTLLNKALFIQLLPVRRKVFIRVALCKE